MISTETINSVISLTSLSLKPDVCTRMAVWYLDCTFSGTGLAYLSLLCAVPKENLGLRFGFLFWLGWNATNKRILLNLQNVELESMLYIMLYIIKCSLAMYD